mgnify:CR=1 FL=1
MLDYLVHTCFLLCLLLLILPGWALRKDWNLPTLSLRCALGENLVFLFLFPILWVDDASEIAGTCWLAVMAALFLAALGLAAARFTRFRPLVILFAFLPIVIISGIRLFGNLFIMS